MSEICITSSSAATRGRTFLPDAVAGAEDRIVRAGERDDDRRHFFGETVGQMRRVRDEHLGDAVELGGRFSSRCAGVAPATSTCTSPPIAFAAVSAFAVAPLSVVVRVFGK